MRPIWKAICVLPPVDADNPRCEAVTAELRALEETAGAPPPLCSSSYYCGRAPRTGGGGEGLWAFR